MVKRQIRPDGTVEADTATSNDPGQGQQPETRTTTWDQNAGPGTTVQQPNTGTVIATTPEPEAKISDRDRKYMEDVRTINNLLPDDPLKFQQERGYYPRRGDVDTDIEIGGLSKQDRLDVIAGRKSLEQTDDSGRKFRVVDRPPEGQTSTPQPQTQPQAPTTPQPQQG
jgi:hypothetical protein